MLDVFHIIVNSVGITCLILGTINFKHIYIYILFSLFFIGNIYLYGFTLIWLLLIKIFNNYGRFKVNFYISIISLLWILFMLISMIGNEYSIRMIYQIFEIFFYIVLMFLCYDFFHTSNKMNELLKSLILGSTILGIYNLILINGVNNIIGVNESSLIIVLFGIILPLLYYDKTSSFWWLLLVLLNFSIIFILEARAATLITLVLASIFFSHKIFTNYSKLYFLLLFGMILFIFLIEVPRSYLIQELLNKIAIQSTSTQERISMLYYGFDLFKNKPLNGYGIGSVEYLMSFSNSSFSRHPHPHNNYVYLLMEYGIFGILLKLVFTITIIYNKFKTNNITYRFKLLFVLCFLLFSFTNVIFYGASRMIPFCILFAYSMHKSKIYHTN